MKDFFESINEHWSASNLGPSEPLTFERFQAAIKHLVELPAIPPPCPHPFLMGRNGAVPKQVLILGKEFYQVCPACGHLQKI
jgi:hypothetical protein